MPALAPVPEAMPGRSSPRRLRASQSGAAPAGPHLRVPGARGLRLPAAAGLPGGGEPSLRGGRVLEACGWVRAGWDLEPWDLGQLLGRGKPWFASLITHSGLDATVFPQLLPASLQAAPLPSAASQSQLYARHRLLPGSCSGTCSFQDTAGMAHRALQPSTQGGGYPCTDWRSCPSMHASQAWAHAGKTAARRHPVRSEAAAWTQPAR